MIAWSEGARMNEFSVAKRIKALLQAKLWSGGNSPVFGDVLVTAGVSMEAYKSQLRWPFVLILVGNIEADDDAADLAVARFTVKMAQRVAGDNYGESAVIGGPSPSNLVSDARGILDLQTALFDTIQLLTVQDGVRIQWISSSAIGATIDEDHGYIVERDYEFEAWVGLGSNP